MSAFGGKADTCVDPALQRDDAVGRRALTHDSRHPRAGGDPVKSHPALHLLVLMQVMRARKWSWHGPSVRRVVRCSRFPPPRE